MRTTDRRDVVGSVVVVCQTCISCELLAGGASNISRTELLVDMPFFFRFCVLSVVPPATCFDMMGVCRVKQVLLRQPGLSVHHLGTRLYLKMSYSGGMLSLWHVWIRCGTDKAKTLSDGTSC